MKQQFGLIFLRLLVCKNVLLLFEINQFKFVFAVKNRCVGEVRNVFENVRHHTKWKSWKLINSFFLFRGLFRSIG